MSVEPQRDINDLFRNKFCINLDRRPDRWQRMQERFAQHGIRSVRRVSAVDGSRLSVPSTWQYSTGAYGCLLSHLNIINDARRLGLSDVLIFEDDTILDPSFRAKFALFLQGLPEDWDMIFFGALHRQDPIPITEGVSRVSQAYSTYAYALKNTVFDKFAASNTRAERPVDVNNFELQADYKCYCCFPNLAWVEPQYSDVQRRTVDHWYLRESIVTHGQEMDRLLQRTAVVILYENSGMTESGRQNLIFLLSFYARFLNGITTIVVERGNHGRVDPADLPIGSRHHRLTNGGSLESDPMISGILADIPAEFDYVILSDSNTFVEALDIRANLRMCERYDCATGFKSVIAMNEDETQRLRNSKQTTAMDDEVVVKPGLKNAGVRFRLTRRRAEAVSETVIQEVRDGLGDASRNQVDRNITIFDSPNRALRLYHG